MKRRNRKMTDRETRLVDCAVNILMYFNDGSDFDKPKARTLFNDLENVLFYDYRRDIENGL